MIAVVMKGFAGHRPGDLVDTTGWRNTESQRRARQIRGVDASELALYEKGIRNIHDRTKSKQKAAAA